MFPRKYVLEKSDDVCILAAMWIQHVTFRYRLLRQERCLPMLSQCCHNVVTMRRKPREMHKPLPVLYDQLQQLVEANRETDYRWLKVTISFSDIIYRRQDSHTENVVGIKTKAKINPSFNWRVQSKADDIDVYLE